MDSMIDHWRPVLVPGLGDSGPLHWQTLWQQHWPEAVRITQRDWNTPDLPVWSNTVAQTLATLDRPALLIAHSFGCLASVHAARRRLDRIGAALLVAPADPDKFDVGPRLPTNALGFPAIVVASDNDPWMALNKARYWASLWQADFLVLPGAGHINADSGLGAWPEGLPLLSRLARHPGNGTIEMVQAPA